MQLHHAHQHRLVVGGGVLFLHGFYDTDICNGVNFGNGLVMERVLRVAWCVLSVDTEPLSHFYNFSA